MASDDRYYIEAIAAEQAALYAAQIQQEQQLQVQQAQLEQQYLLQQQAEATAALQAQYALDLTQYRRDLALDEVRDAIRSSWDYDSYVQPVAPVYDTDWGGDPNDSWRQHEQIERQLYLDAEAAAQQALQQQVERDLQDAQRRAEDATQQALDMLRHDAETRAQEDAQRFLDQQQREAEAAAQQFQDIFLRQQSDAADQAAQEAIRQAALDHENARLMADQFYAEEIARAEALAREVQEREYSERLAAELAQAELNHSLYNAEMQARAEAEMATWAAQFHDAADRAATEQAELAATDLRTQMLVQEEAVLREQLDLWSAQERLRAEADAGGHAADIGRDWFDAAQQEHHAREWRDELDRQQQAAEAEMQDRLRRELEIAAEDAARQARELVDAELERAREAHLSRIAPEGSRHDPDADFRAAMDQAEQHAAAREAEERDRLFAEMERLAQDRALEDLARQSAEWERAAQSHADEATRLIADEHRRGAEDAAAEALHARIADWAEAHEARAAAHQAELEDLYRAEIEQKARELFDHRHAEEMAQAADQAEAYRRDQHDALTQMLAAEAEHRRTEAERLAMAAAVDAAAAVLDHGAAEASAHAEAARQQAADDHDAVLDAVDRHRDDYLAMSADGARTGAAHLSGALIDNARLLARDLLAPDLDPATARTQQVVEQAWAAFLAGNDARISRLAAQVDDEITAMVQEWLLELGISLNNIDAKISELARQVDRKPDPIESANAAERAFGADAARYLSPWDGQAYPIASSRRARRAANAHDRATIAESEDYNRLLSQGMVGLQRPGRVNEGGPDSILYDPETGYIIVRDTKLRGPGGQFPDPAELQSKRDKWNTEIGDAVKACLTGDPGLDAAVKAAWEANRVVLQQVDIRGPALPWQEGDEGNRGR